MKIIVRSLLLSGALFLIGTVQVGETAIVMRLLSENINPALYRIFSSKYCASIFSDSLSTEKWHDPFAIINQIKPGGETSSGLAQKIDTVRAPEFSRDLDGRRVESLELSPDNASLVALTYKANNSEYQEYDDDRLTRYELVTGSAKILSETVEPWRSILYVGDYENWFFAPDGQYAFEGRHKGSAYTWPSGQTNSGFTMALNGAPVTTDLRLIEIHDSQFTSDSKLVFEEYIPHEGYRLIIDGKPFWGFWNYISSSSVLSDGRIIIVGSKDRYLENVVSVNGKVISTWGYIRSFVVSPDGHMAFFAEHADEGLVVLDNKIVSSGWDLPQPIDVDPGIVWVFGRSWYAEPETGILDVLTTSKKLLTEYLTNAGILRKKHESGYGFVSVEFSPGGQVLAGGMCAEKSTYRLGENLVYQASGDWGTWDHGFLGDDTLYIVEMKTKDEEARYTQRLRVQGNPTSSAWERIDSDTILSKNGKVAFSRSTSTDWDTHYDRIGQSQWGCSAVGGAANSDCAYVSPSGDLIEYFATYGQNSVRANGKLLGTSWAHITHVDSSADGKIAFISTDETGKQNLLVNGQVLVSAVAEIVTYGFSPDGSRISVALKPIWSDTTQIRVYDLSEKQD